MNSKNSREDPVQSEGLSEPYRAAVLTAIRVVPWLILINHPAVLFEDRCGIFYFYPDAVTRVISIFRFEKGIGYEKDFSM